MENDENLHFNNIKFDNNLNIDSLETLEPTHLFHNIKSVKTLYENNKPTNANDILFSFGDTPEKPNIISNSPDNENKETGYFKLSDFKKQLKLFSGYNCKKEVKNYKLQSNNANTVDLSLNINNNKNRNDLIDESYFVKNYCTYNNNAQNDNENNLVDTPKFELGSINSEYEQNAKTFIPDSNNLDVCKKNSIDNKLLFLKNKKEIFRKISKKKLLNLKKIPKFSKNLKMNNIIKSKTSKKLTINKTNNNTGNNTNTNTFTNFYDIAKRSRFKNDKVNININISNNVTNKINNQDILFRNNSHNIIHNRNNIRSIKGRNLFNNFNKENYLEYTYTDFRNLGTNDFLTSFHNFYKSYDKKFKQNRSILHSNKSNNTHKQKINISKNNSRNHSKKCLNLKNSFTTKNIKTKDYCIRLDSIKNFDKINNCENFRKKSNITKYDEFYHKKNFFSPKVNDIKININYSYGNTRINANNNLISKNLKRNKSLADEKFLMNTVKGKKFNMSEKQLQKNHNRIKHINDYENKNNISRNIKNLTKNKSYVLDKYCNSFKHPMSKGKIIINNVNNYYNNKLDKNKVGNLNDNKEVKSNKCNKRNNSLYNRRFFTNSKSMNPKTFNDEINVLK